MRTDNWRLSKSLAAMVLILSMFSACSLPLKPTNEEIREAVRLSNEAESNPLELQYEWMEVPQRSFGQAAAVMWIPDKSIQRNYRIRFEKTTGRFIVQSYITLKLDQNGVYRQLDNVKEP